MVLKVVVVLLNLILNHQVVVVLVTKVNEEQVYKTPLSSEMGVFFYLE